MKLAYSYKFKNLPPDVKSGINVNLFVSDEMMQKIEDAGYKSSDMTDVVGLGQIEEERINEGLVMYNISLELETVNEKFNIPFSFSKREDAEKFKNGILDLQYN